MCSLSKDLPLVIAHRGAAGEAPENTLAAFQLALEQGCDAFELDVHLSKDGQIVVIHDYSVDRTTTGQGAVSELTVEEMKQYDAGAWFHPSYAGERIPTLEEVIAMTPEHIHINVEIKGGIGQGIEEKLVELLRRLNRTASIFVSSFHWNCLRTLNQIEPSLRVGLLYDLSLKDYALLPKAAGVNAYSLHPHFGKLEAEAVKAAVAQGVAVFPWTINGEADMARMIDMGVSGIITDYPGKLRQLLEQQSAARS
ncbi:glycerophosphodiester phosphodiesterase [Paenibacillus spongiae]|uniref:Glycerophosphodiester phosphodiesterase n=1 Tax=Paenibacillus spongiae TaxID=2909671 RepID=A0ABY5SC35_9BACL|nr:glycerophosphodiester phosphodiesterase [Paenibacillus spongiae]UVI31085.1 glycerophosphodiester phosphodiesterase [Paenibacillus spongiae]